MLHLNKVFYLSWSGEVKNSILYQCYPGTIYPPQKITLLSWTRARKERQMVVWGLMCNVALVLPVSAPIQCPLPMPKHGTIWFSIQIMEIMQELLTAFPSTLVRHWCHFSRVHRSLRLCCSSIRHYFMCLHPHCNLLLVTNGLGILTSIGKSACDSYHTLILSKSFQWLWGLSRQRLMLAFVCFGFHCFVFFFFSISHHFSLSAAYYRREHIMLLTDLTGQKSPVQKW